MNVLVNWDPSVLRLVGNDNNGPYQWMFAGFPDDSAGDGLNNTFEDGNARFDAWSQLFVRAEATPAGLLVTTLEFEALDASPGTTIGILESYGKWSITAVFGGSVPGLNIVGELGSITIAVGTTDGDVDGDGDVDLSDLTLMLRAFGTCSGDAYYDPNADFDGDNCITLNDVTVLLRNFTGS